MSIVDCSAAISDCLSAGADWSDWSVCFSKRGIVCDDSMAALLALNMQLAFRQALQCGVAKQSRDAALRLVDVATIVSAHSTLDKSTPFLLLEDIFEQQTRSEFLPTLSYLESNIQRLMNLDFKKSRTSTLALCNAILRRLSKAQDAEISGRLLIVLASALTLDERSGVNLAGRFASQSEATSVAPVGQVKAAAAKTESKSVDSNQSIDDEDFADAHDLLPSSSDSTPAQSARSFYDTLWSLQACFAEPNTLSSEAQLTIFTSGMP
jgi:THO complex subunit 1